MSDTSPPAVESTVSTPREDDKWTILSSSSNADVDARSSTSAGSSPSNSDSVANEEELTTVTPSSPARSLVGSEESEPKLVVSTSPSDLTSPITTPLPASPADDSEDTLPTPKDTKWARSRSPISEGGEAEASENETVGESTEKESVLEEAEKNIPSLTFTQATLSPNHFDSKSPNEVAGDSKEEKKSDSPPSVDRIDTQLAPTFLTDSNQLFTSPTFTNNAAPNSAVSPKTASFFFGSGGERSPPRVGGAVIMELPSDADTADESNVQERQIEPKKEEEEEDEPEKPSSNSTQGKTIPLISPNHSSDVPKERPVSSCAHHHHVSTFSRDHSPAPRTRAIPEKSKLREVHRLHAHQPRRVEKESMFSPARPSSSQFRSRTYVSSSRPPPPRSSHRLKEEEPRVEKSMSMKELVVELKKALSKDSTTYYTLKGLLAEYEETQRRSIPSPKVKEDTTGPSSNFAKVTISERIVKEEAKEEKLTPRRYRHSFKPAQVPVRSFSLTQTDTESEAETYTFPRRDEREIHVDRAQQGTRGAQPVPLQVAPSPQAPAYPAHLSPRSQHARLSPFYDTFKLGDREASKKGDSLERDGLRLLSMKELLHRATRSNFHEVAWKLRHQTTYTIDSMITRPELDVILTTPKSSPLFSAEVNPSFQPSSAISALKNRPDLQSLSSPSSKRVDPSPASHRRVVPDSTRHPARSSHDTAPSKPLILVNYLRPAPSSRRQVAPVQSMSGRKRQVGEEGRKVEGSRKKAVGGKGKEKEVIVAKAEKGKGKGKERDNSISFDFDDFF